VLSAFVLIGNPLIVMAIMGYMGYRKRTGFLAGLTVAQISEFSIVFVAMGITLGHVGMEALGLTTLVGLVTITLSTYMILYSQRLYEWLSPWLGPFERSIPFREIAVEVSGIRVLGVDFDPEVVRDERRALVPVRFGDAQDVDFVDALPLEGVPWVVSSLPDVDSVQALLHALEARGYRGGIAVVARDEAQGARLERLGGVTVLYPFRDAVDYVGDQLARQVLDRSEAT
jgi:hypothetical protein